MSYLVDALKKAERERHAQRDAGLGAAAAGETAGGAHRSSRALIAVLAVLALFNLGLLAYLFSPQRTSDVAHASPPAADRIASHDRNPGAAGDVHADGPSDNHRGSNDTPRRISTAAPRARTGSSGVAESPRTTAQASTISAVPAPSGTRKPRGSVTYAPAPLDQDTALARANAASGDRAPPARAVSAALPRVTINGQLYSSVPGRSFILVRGRRYHEGQRLAAGPAVERIDPDGATLLYRGQRYHVNGPG